MPKEYIEREAMFDSSNIIAMHTREYGNIEVVPVDCLVDIPSADVVEVVHGRWIGEMVTKPDWRGEV